MVGTESWNRNLAQKSYVPNGKKRKNLEKLSEYVVSYTITDSLFPYRPISNVGATRGNITILLEILFLTM